MSFDDIEEIETDIDGAIKNQDTFDDPVDDVDSDVEDDEDEPTDDEEEEKPELEDDEDTITRSGSGNSGDDKK